MYSSKFKCINNNCFLSRIMFSTTLYCYSIGLWGVGVLTLVAMSRVMYGMNGFSSIRELTNLCEGVQ